MDTFEFNGPGYNYKLKCRRILNHKDRPDFKFIIETLKTYGCTFRNINPEKETFIFDGIYALFTFDPALYVIHISFRMDEQPDNAAHIVLFLIHLFHKFHVDVAIDEPFYILDGVCKIGDDAVELYAKDVHLIIEERAKKIFKEYKILDNLTEDNARYKA